MNELLKSLQDRRLVDELDVHFAGLMLRLHGEESEELALAAALLSQWRQRGHACLDLDSLQVADDEGDALELPEPGAWVRALEHSPVVGAAHEFKPLILTAPGRLYLRRYWEYEEEVYYQLSKRIEEGDLPADASLAERLDRLFADGAEDQRNAVETAMRKRFCVISGGPGTGKTTTAVRLLAVLLMDEDRPPRIRLAAPTGKAAARLEESIAESIGELPLSEAVRERLPTSASTLHRLLRFRSGSSVPGYDAERPLDCDVLMVDEASMVDLALMAKLLRAAPPECRIVLLGDKDQLASVEAGSVLGDLCLDGDAGRLAGHIALLRKNYRFGEDSGIGALARAVNRGASPEALQLVRGDSHRDLAWKTVVNPERLDPEWPALAARFAGLAGQRDPVEALRELAGFRILCAVRHGPFGVEAVNEAIRKQLPVPPGPWYAGRPVMVTENDYHLDLFNGDVGIALRRSDGDLRVWFQRRDGSLRAFHPGRLPPHETVYAMTVHKSQGSQFGDVLLVLPDRPVPVLSRELVYTAVTRAREKVSIWGREEILAEAIGRKVERFSGLRDYFR